MTKVKIIPITSDSSVNEASEAFHALKILALVNENSPATPALEYLKRRGHQLEIRNNLMDGIHQLSLFEPDVLLLSWNLKNTDIKRVYPLITNKFNSICFVIGEDNSNKTTSQLMSSGLPNLIFPPVGGINLFSRIKTAIDSAIEVVSSAERMNQAQISKDIDWKIRLNADKTQDQIWEAVHFKPETKTTDYLYVKGEKPNHEQAIQSPTDSKSLPDVLVFDQPANQEVLLLISKKGNDNKSPGAPNKMPSWQFSMKPVIEKPVKKVDNEFVKQIQEAMNFKAQEQTEDHVKVQNGGAQREDPLGRVVTSNSDEVILLRPKSENQALEVGIQTAIILALESEFENFDSPILIDQVSHLSVSIIKSKSFSGYLVSGQSDDLTNPELMKKVYQNLQDEMQKHGETLSMLGACLELELKPISFKELARHQADFVLNSKQGSNEISFAYLPVDTLPEAFSEEEMTAVEKHFFVESQYLTFDVFLHMPKNQKYVHFLKRGASFSTEAISRLDGFGVKKLFIKKADQSLFYAYCVRNHIERDGPLSS